jgi:membrane protein implicated in regulation of membrane protease activity
MDAIVLTRIALGMLFWPVAALIAVGGGIALGIVLLASYPVQTVVGAATLAVAGIAASRWFSARQRPPGD